MNSRQVIPFVLFPGLPQVFEIADDDYLQAWRIQENQLVFEALTTPGGATR
jgi:hypothetical protein